MRDEHRLPVGQNIEPVRLVEAQYSRAMPVFLPGIELSRRFYQDVVAPFMESALPQFPHSAALLGPGSEVLGFDTKRSTDRDWGPRLQLFLHPPACAAHARQLDSALAAELPPSYRGYCLRFRPDGSHGVVVSDLPTWCDRWLAIDPYAELSLLDWLATPTQRLAEITTGAVFHDGLGDLTRLRERLRWYPDEVWRYILACQWHRIEEREALVGRCVEIGDQRGARVVSSSLVHELMRLQLLMQRRYPPSTRWLGSAYAALERAERLDPDAVVDEPKLRHAYVAAAVTFNGLGITPPVDPAPRRLATRPYMVLGAGRFVDALRGSLRDPRIAALPLIGAIDQFVDNAEVLNDPVRCRTVTSAALGLGA